MAAPRRCAWLHGNFQLEACGSRVQNFKKGATIFRTSQVLKNVGMFVTGEMFGDVSGDVSVGFTDITGTTACS